MPPTFVQLESWAGPGRVLRATEADVSAWRLPPSARAALVLSGVPLLDDIVCEASFQTAPTTYRLAFHHIGDSADTTWEYDAVPGTGEVHLWASSRRGGSSFVNSSIIQWLCSLHLVGGRFAESTVLDRWDDSAETEEQALSELAGLLDQIAAIDPAAIADGDHERQFWPGLLDRWLF